MNLSDQFATGQKNSSQSKKSFFKRFWWIWLILAVLLAGLIIFARMKTIEERLEPSQTAKYVTASPFDLNQIESISRFRSCEGHDYSGQNFAFEPEADRSMKHYVMPRSEFKRSDNKVKMFAPFDGEVGSIVMPEPSADTGAGKTRGGSMNLITPLDRYVTVELGHIKLANKLKKGDKVKAGELLGYAVVPDEYNDFDLIVRAIHYGRSENYIFMFDSLFNHMTDGLIAEYTAYGLMPEKLIYPKTLRDQNPCNFPPSDTDPVSPLYRNVNRSPDDRVRLTK